MIRPRVETGGSARESHVDLVMFKSSKHAKFLQNLRLSEVETRYTSDLKPKSSMAIHGLCLQYYSTTRKVMDPLCGWVWGQ